VPLFCSSIAQAADCGPYTVVSIQAQSGDVLVYLTDQTGSGFWKELGPWSAPSTKPYLAVVQEALAMGRQITLRYGDPYACTSTDYVTAPYMVRM
jgi:hypothetical protein